MGGRHCPKAADVAAVAAVEKTGASKLGTPCFFPRWADGKGGPESRPDYYLACHCHPTVSRSVVSLPSTVSSF